MTRDPARAQQKPLSRKGPARADDEDEPVLPNVSRDETGEGWGDESSARDAEWYRRERPPHHGD